MAHVTIQDNCISSYLVLDGNTAVTIRKINSLTRTVKWMRQLPNTVHTITHLKLKMSRYCAKQLIHILQNNERMICRQSYPKLQIFLERSCFKKRRTSYEIYHIYQIRGSSVIPTI